MFLWTITNDQIQGNPQEIKRHTGDGNNPISANKPPLPDRQEQGTPVLIRQTSNPQHPSPEGQSQPQLVRQPMQGNPQQGQQQFVRPVQVVRQGISCIANLNLPKFKLTFL